jgi:NhaA family Na+:H+ antiporter
MIAPASIYAALHAGGPAASGWGVPMATDIAFAVAALAVLRDRVAPGLKVFLLALAIVDDLGAVTVIALFYTHGISLPALGAAGVGLLVAAVAKRLRVQAFAFYWLVGAATWLAMLQSGVHATVAGVLLGLLTPATALAPGERASPIGVLTARLHPWVAFGVMPTFALANAGVVLQVSALSDPLALRVAAGVALGLLLGKPLGITGLAWVAVRLGIAVLPAGASWGAVFGVGMLGGIGFTMAIFITVLAFDEPALVYASKLGVLVASALATGAGLAVLARTTRPGGAGR